MAAKSFGTPRIIESSEVSMHTSGSNHIWKTSSGNSDLKSHFTVSQRLGERDKAGMRGGGMAGLFTLHRRMLPTCPILPHPRPLVAMKIAVRPSLEGKGEKRVYKQL